MVALLVLLLVSGAPERHADSELLGALGYLKVRGHELHLPIAYPTADKRRLPLVDSLMTSPLRLTAAADSLARELEEAESVVGIIKIGAAMLALPEEAAPAGLTVTAPAAVAPLLRARLVAARLVDAAFDSVGPADRDTLERWALALLSEDPETADKGPFELEWIERQVKLRDDAVFRAENDVHTEHLATALKVLAAAVPSVAPNAQESWRTDAARPCPYATGDVLWWQDDSLGPVVVGGTGRTVYIEPVSLALDLGGDDLYLASVGGTGHGRFRASLCVDLSGCDVYRDTTAASFGAGFMGAGLLADLEGDDTYVTGSFGLGAGIVGAGALIDYAGNDRYVGDICVQGAGHMGIGLLEDRGGTDLYSAALFSQAFGHVGAVGILLDRGGNDTYILQGPYTDIIRYNDHSVTLGQGFGFGHRPRFSGGIGLLVDVQGNDNYFADIFGQGTSYWYALGALVDGGGNDCYVCYQYAQGCGVHLSLGCLLDRAGNDCYRAKGVGQGCGHDYAAGFLVDRSGDDAYSAFDLSQGAGNANGLGVLIDAGGNDSYAVNRVHNTQGYGNSRRDSGSLGLLLDLEGDDSFSVPTGAESLWVGSRWGLGWDLDGVATEAPETEEPTVSWDEERDTHFAARFDQLEQTYILASRTEPKFSSLAQEAGDEVVRKWHEMIPLLLDRLTTDNASERWRLADLFRKAGDAGVEPLLGVLQGGDPDAASCALFVLWRMKDTEPDSAPVHIPDEPLLPLLAHDHWTIRASVARLLGMLGEAGSAPRVAELLHDAVPESRHAAVVALGRLGACEFARDLARLLGDADHRVRYGAAEALAGLGGDCVLEFLLEALAAEDSITVALAAEVLGELGAGDVAPRLRGLLVHPSVLVRGEATRALSRLGDTQPLPGADAPAFVRTMLRRGAAERSSP